MIVIELERTGPLGLDIAVRVVDTIQRDEAAILGERIFPADSRMARRLSEILYGQSVRIELGREGN